MKKQYFSPSFESKNIVFVSDVLGDSNPEVTKSTEIIDDPGNPFGGYVDPLDP